MRRVLLPLLLALVLAAAALWWFSRPLPILTVVTWPGAYGRAQASAQMHPFGAAAHVDVRPAQYDGGLDELARAVATKTYAGDVIDMELPDAVKACRQGLLEHIDPATLPTNVRATHMSLFDGSLQGIELTDKPAFSFQGHPEASPGPHDLLPLFDRFTQAMIKRLQQQLLGRPRPSGTDN